MVFSWLNQFLFLSECVLMFFLYPFGGFVPMNLYGNNYIPSLPDFKLSCLLSGLGFQCPDRPVCQQQWRGRLCLCRTGRSGCVTPSPSVPVHECPRCSPPGQLGLLSSQHRGGGGGMGGFPSNTGGRYVCRAVLGNPRPGGLMWPSGSSCLALRMRHPLPILLQACACKVIPEQP